MEEAKHSESSFSKAWGSVINKKGLSKRWTREQMPLRTFVSRTLWH